MKNLSIFNKLFILLCAALIALLAFTVPHEKNEKGMQQTTVKADE